jgi:hypothetical protein
VGEIGTKEGHLVGWPAEHVATGPLPLAELPLSPHIPYLWASSDMCAKGLTHSVRKLRWLANLWGRQAPLRVSLGHTFLPRLLHVM